MNPYIGHESQLYGVEEHRLVGGKGDGMRLFEEITYPDSLGRTFYALPDGSYLLGENGAETIYGEAYRIRDGKMERISGPGEAFHFEVKEA